MEISNKAGGRGWEKLSTLELQEAYLTAINLKAIGNACLQVPLIFKPSNHIA